MYDEIKNYIKTKKRDIDDRTLEYYTNYFYILSKTTHILGSNNIEELIDNALVYASKINFYGKDSEKYKKLGPDCKGERDPKDKTIYIREDLSEPLREITIYHELHHAVQTNPKNEKVGINQNSNIGRLIMEAQTQFFAEKIYQEIHNVTFEEKIIPSENLRMMQGGQVTSALHNYEMYDSILSKLAIMLDVDKDFFVHINYLYEDNKGMKILKEKYEEKKKKYNYPYTFEDLMYKLDYIYCTDILAYVDNEEKETILSGKPTKKTYQIYPGKKGEIISQKIEFNTISDIDRKYFLCLLEANGNYKLYSKYILKDKIRYLAEQIIENDSQESKTTQDGSDKNADK